VEPEASKLQVSPLHEAVNEAVGTPLEGFVSLPGWTTTENITARETAALVVAVRPAAVPVPTAVLESPRTPLTLPEPVAAAVVLEVVSPGSVQVVVTEDFSPQ
jgi:hypothetical protein